MGNYREIKGNLIELTKAKEFDVIGHGANCFQTMGAGIALQIRNHFPEAYKADLHDGRQAIQRLGDLSYAVNPLSGTYIVNLYSQYDAGPNLDYSALELSLRKLTMIFDKDECRIGLPLIGCGIAGGDWEKVKEIIQRVLSEYDVTVVIYNK